MAKVLDPIIKGSKSQFLLRDYNQFGIVTNKSLLTNYSFILVSQTE